MIKTNLFRKESKITGSALVSQKEQNTTYEHSKVNTTAKYVEYQE